MAPLNQNLTLNNILWKNICLGIFHISLLNIHYTGHSGHIGQIGHIEINICLASHFGNISWSWSILRITLNMNIGQIGHIEQIHSVSSNNKLRPKMTNVMSKMTNNCNTLDISNLQSIQICKCSIL